ncbi:hypothetical protein GL297_15560 [Komagataeibacter sp. FXV2]|nr:hypothetical protein [Komagataeibacter sp. FXV2]
MMLVVLLGMMVFVSLFGPDAGGVMLVWQAGLAAACLLMVAWQGGAWQTCLPAAVGAVVLGGLVAWHLRARVHPVRHGYALLLRLGGGLLMVALLSIAVPPDALDVEGRLEVVAGLSAISCGLIAAGVERDRARQCAALACALEGWLLLSGIAGRALPVVVGCMMLAAMVFMIRMTMPRDPATGDGAW